MENSITFNVFLLKPSLKLLKSPPLNTHFIYLHLLEAKHCPVTSDVRSLISKPPPTCQSETLLRLFDENYKSEVPECSCCYSCVKRHSVKGCETCSNLLDKYFPPNCNPKLKKSVISELKEAMGELFAALGADTLLVEGELEVTAKNFVKDFLKMSDEVNTESDIIEMWHIDKTVAHKIFMLFNEVVFGDLYDSDDDSDTASESEIDLDEDDQSTDSE